MRKSLPTVLLLALLVGACAPAQPVATPSPAPAPTEPAVDPVGPVEPEVALEPMDRWWLLDETSDAFPGTSADLAYREALRGRTPRREVVVAILDSGIDIEHEDLNGVIWVNEGEIPGNGVDDDGNGYVDDVHGWNFIGGPDGQQVHRDTYELTRLYAALRHYEGANPDTLNAEGKAEHAAFVSLAQEFAAERATTAQQIQELQQINTMVTHFVGVLKRALQTDSLTVEAVRRLTTSLPEVRQAQQVYLGMMAEGFTPEDIADQLDYVENKLRYGLNPDFDPRHIVGDNYEDVTERYYGNALVEGPDADHGTHVAGIVAAQRDNGVGVDGIASGARIMVVRTVPDGDERDKDVANAIRYAVDNGAHIINMSFGKGHSPRKDAVDAAVRYADERGVLLVHAAGNDAADTGTEPNFPNRYYLDGDTARLWIEVGASSFRAPEGIVAPFSNYNAARVDVFAPGHQILSTVPGDAYEANSGTSMAAPVVSGLAALIMAYYPELDAAQVKRVILESAVQYPGRQVILPGTAEELVPFESLSATGGVVNALRAVQLAEQVVSGEAGW